MQVPRLTAKQEEALQYLNALARSDDLRMDMNLEPGDIQLLYNHTMLHMRGAFDDHDVSPGPWRSLQHEMQLCCCAAPLDSLCAHLLAWTCISVSRQRHGYIQCAS